MGIIPNLYVYNINFLEIMKNLYYLSKIKKKTIDKIFLYTLSTI